MKKSALVGLGLLVLAALLIPLYIFLPRKAAPRDDPRAHMPERPAHTDHTALMKGPFTSGPEVTEACLTCHEDAAAQVMKTSHWTWESHAVRVAGHDKPVSLGKKNAINNFCIGIQSNWPGCTSCHAGYGWEDASYDFNKETNVDCLVCHEQTGTYVKASAGIPADDVDLLAVAKSVGGPSRDNCGGCHFSGGGGNAVKHGDLDASLYQPSERLDVHMGRYDFLCTDCHRTKDHQIGGRALSVSLDATNQVACIDCHSETLHKDERINAHVETVACQTCHIPAMALDTPTKVHWDWSAAGQDLPEDTHTYLKIKGAFVYRQQLKPEFYWFNGTVDHYLMGDKIDSAGVTILNKPRGDIHDPGAKIWPFKVHRGEQVYDRNFQYLLQPKTVGEGGYWADFNWDQALRLGAVAANLPYSGSYGFTETAMFWPTTHMVAPATQALQCTDCHSENGRFDWARLGYDGDPMVRGGRKVNLTFLKSEDRHQ